MSEKLQDIEDGEIIEESIVETVREAESDTMTLYEVDVMALVKQMDLQQRYFFWQKIIKNLIHTI